ncbi:MAG: DUF4974 domain-containing protein [Flavobacteriaceae bacterium]|nr:DUF4974 domain-containing protein [Flavobacteriaceae bacterium]
MPIEEIDVLIVKYLTNEANSEDLNLLSELLDDANTKKTFHRYVKIHYEITGKMNELDKEELKKILFEKIRKEKDKHRKDAIRKLLPYAAALVALLTIGYFYVGIHSRTDDVDSYESSSLLIPKDEPVTLQIEGDIFKQINNGEHRMILDPSGNLIVQQSGDRLDYSVSLENQRHRYNTLNVARGKTFEVILSDGTQVLLNSGSSFRYPEKFFGSAKREVYLTGEAYFDVADDPLSKFIVHVGNMQITVTGTKFNVSNYLEDNHIDVVLVEGGITLSHKHKQNVSVLDAGYKATWSKEVEQIISTEDNVDMNIYTAWISKKIVFRNATFKKIRQTLERHYNVTIINKNKNLDQQRFDATFDIETINEILDAFNASYSIEYEIVDNIAIIN